MPAPTDGRPFRCSALCDTAYADFALLSADLERALNSEIRLADYTDAVDSVYIVPLLFTKPPRLHKEYIAYDRGTRTVYLHPLLAHDALTQATSATYPALLADTIYEKGRALSVLPEALLIRMGEVIRTVGYSSYDSKS